MKRFFTTILTILLFSPAFAQSANDLFQQALVMEHSEGNLKGANLLYERVVTTSSDRALAAKALIRIGENYERQGMLQARNAYQRVIDDYSEQEDVAMIARNRLALLIAGTQENESQQVASGILKRHVMNIPDAMGEVSPDGRFLSLVEWNSGNTGILDLETGELKLITYTGHWGESSSFGDLLIWSQDAKQLTYYWYEEGLAEVRVYDMESEQSSVLFPYNSTAMPSPATWSSDGKSLLALNEQDNHVTDSIVIIDPDTGSSRLVKTLKENWHIFNMDLSPDDSQVVYESFPSGQRYVSDAPISIAIVSTDGSGLHSLVDDGKRNYSPLWSATGDDVLYLSSDGEGTELRAIGIENGEASGGSRLLFSDFEGAVKAEGVTDDGRYFYTQVVSQGSVYEQGIDFSTGETQNNLRVISSARYGQQSSGSVSPSGAFLAFISDGDLVVSHLESGDTRVHELPFTRFQGSDQPAVTWSQDNQFVLVHAQEAVLRGDTVILSINVQDGSYVKLDGIGRFGAGRVNSFIGKDYSDDGKNVVFASNSHVVEMNLSTGTSRVVAEHPDVWMGGMSLSPDGTTVAVTVRRRTDSGERHSSIELISMKDGAVNRLEESSTPQTYSSWVGITWTPDGKNLVFAENRPNEGQQLYVQSVTSGERHAIGEPVFGEDQYRGVSVHPNGKKLTFSKRRAQMELWVIEGIDYDM